MTEQVTSPRPIDRTTLRQVVGPVRVVGNPISRTVITLVALSVPMWVAVVALGYLVLIHKVEYFLNARIVGGEIQARA